MNLDELQKGQIKQKLAELLKAEPEVQKVIVFGSFATSTDPNDLDIAIFQTSKMAYLPLALKYRKLLRPLAERIALDVIPVRPDFAQSTLIREILKGEIVYER